MISIGLILAACDRARRTRRAGDVIAAACLYEVFMEQLARGKRRRSSSLN